MEEITEPEGALVDIRKMPVGGPSMAIVGLWTAEFQRTTPYYSSPSMRRSSARPASACAGRMPVWGDHLREDVVKDSRCDSAPVDWPLDKALGKMPQKTFEMKRLCRTPPESLLCQ